MTRYVLLKKFCDITGYSKKAFERKRQNGVWREGVHFKKAPDGHILVNLEAYEKWVEGEPLAA